MSKFTLYNYVLSGNCYKIRLMAGLLGVTYDTVAVDFYPGLEQRSERMLALNPAGTLPVLVAGDLVLSETQAMLAWLATTHDPSGKWYPIKDASLHAQVLQWLGFSARLTTSVGAARLNAMLDWPVDVEAVDVVLVDYQPQELGARVLPRLAQVDVLKLARAVLAALVRVQAQVAEAAEAGALQRRRLQCVLAAAHVQLDLLCDA